ncbi:MAG: SusE domain-containing protein [Muribaculaceae bacterium]|nr:SusE domain-containing protein [Muribaculaceae bacterium]
MKKISMFLACLTAIVGLSSCSQDRDPVLQIPTKFVLNTPALQNQYYQLEEGNTIELTCSQPDYGYSAIVQYSVEVSLTCHL